MNRTEWDACNDPLWLCDWLRERGSERKFRLMACAAVRRFEWFFRYHSIDPSADVVRQERAADGYPPLPEEPTMPVTVQPHVNRLAASRMLESLARPSGYEAAREVLQAIQAWLNARIRGEEGIHWPITGPDYLDQQYRVQAALLRDLFGQLFHADPLWVGRLENATEVERLAAGIYAGHAFADVPVLGDALEEAGCVDAEVLAHCREPGEHARGCWVLDAILGRR